MKELDNFEQEREILDSFPDNIRRLIAHTEPDDSISIQLASLSGMPAVVRGQDLFLKEFLPNWAFASLLITSPLTIEKKDNGARCRLIVEIPESTNGIYNNAGKLYLRLVYPAEEFSKPSEGISEQLEAFIKSDELGIREFHYPIPFRWASGGVLPIVEYRGREWFVLFRRDVSPIGWNIANGASEYTEEFSDLYRLMRREMSEELILLDRDPLGPQGTPIHHKLIRFSANPDGEELEKIHDALTKHQKLRELHDGLILELDTEGPVFEQITTPFEVEIKRAASDGAVQRNVVENVFFFINPLEFGIETVSIGRMRMEDTDQIIDGELWNDDLLVRQPVLLLSTDFVRSEYANTKRIGTPSVNSSCQDCRVLDRIPYGEYVLFAADIELRKQRLHRLSEDGKGDSVEAKRIASWLGANEPMFSRVDPTRTTLTSTEHLGAVTLCPVTWKTLEKICEYSILA